MTILEQLWQDKIHPAEIKSHDPRYNKFLDIADESETKLLSLLSDEGKKLFEKLTEARSELHAINELEIFKTGFRTGANLILEIKNTDE